MDAEMIGARAREFVEKFLPPGVDSGNSLLFGSGKRSAPTFVPSQEHLERCLSEYAHLIECAAKGERFSLLAFEIMDASELLLAYLSRGQMAGRRIPPNAALADTIRAGEPDLRFLVEMTHGGGHDALKRLLRIAGFVEVHNEVGSR